MSQAVKKYMADEGVDDLRNTPLTSVDDNDDDVERAQKACEDFVQKYLKVVKVCEDGCFADNYTKQNGEISDYVGIKPENAAYTGKFVLADGTVLDITYGHVSSFGSVPITLHVDINGRKGPNKIGYDLWEMDIFYDGSIDESNLNPECKKDNKYCNDAYGNSPKEIRDNRFDMCKSQDSGAYGGCFGHFLENGFKFDY